MIDFSFPLPLPHPRPSYSRRVVPCLRRRDGRGYRQPLSNTGSHRGPLKPFIQSNTSNSTFNQRFVPSTYAWRRSICIAQHAHGNPRPRFLKVVAQARRQGWERISSRHDRSCGSDARQRPQRVSWRELLRRTQQAVKKGAERKADFTCCGHQAAGMADGSSVASGASRARIRPLCWRRDSGQAARLNGLAELAKQAALPATTITATVRPLKRIVAQQARDDRLSSASDYVHGLIRERQKRGVAAHFAICSSGVWLPGRQPDPCLKHPASFRSTARGWCAWMSIAVRSCRLPAPLRLPVPKSSPPRSPAPGCLAAR
jgi:hypothetical protein